MDNVTSLPQKIALAILSLALLAGAIFSIVQMYAARDHKARIAALEQSINEPVTGYADRLAAARANSGTLEAAVNRQTAAIKAQADQARATLATVQARYDAEHAARVEAEKRVAVFMSTPPKGPTLDARIRDIDARILGELK